MGEESFIIDFTKIQDIISLSNEMKGEATLRGLCLQMNEPMLASAFSEHKAKSTAVGGQPLVNISSSSPQRKLFWYEADFEPVVGTGVFLKIDLESG